MGRTVFAALCAMLLLSSPAWGHGVTYGVIPDHAVAVRFAYAGGEPMSYAETKVFGPDSPPDLEYQNGRTDARGVVSFVPDAPGTWTVTAWDESGHKGALEVPVTGSEAGLAAQAASVPQGGGATPVSVGLGLSLLANLALLVMVLRQRKRAG
ncbi:hypothetical protein DND132_1888 [Pseudodesulfovibrio mercurii]|uniref:Nickel transport protein n=1 Tax=Pseudodesulfovibrio mercurii TaxID=641491 RepID=F0JGH7_9BACT|nr:hypothetical protein [Pseudodesulfovibrio mercurii]EGB15094.1 hypothetical protein DND132_1888 [Pseudodesulfovibrio mercurii]